MFNYVQLPFRPGEYFTPVQGEAYGCGKDFVDIQVRSSDCQLQIAEQLQLWADHIIKCKQNLFRDHTLHPAGTPNKVFIVTSMNE